MKKKVLQAIDTLQNGDVGQEFTDERPYELGELYERISAKDIIDYAQRLPRIKIPFDTQEVNFNGSILQNTWDCRLL